MRPIKFLSLLTLFVAVLVVLAAPAPDARAAGDSPGKLEFKANNQIYNANGSFEKWHFTRVDVPEGDLTKGTVAFEVDLASVSEKASALADHLRTADFFDVAKFTTAKVTIDRAKKTGDSTYEATALIDFHGVEKEVPVKFEVVGTAPLKVKGKATMSRTAFGIGGPYDPKNERSITDDVEILLSATLE